MKLRIQGSKLRLRLSKSETHQIGQGININETVHLGNDVSFNYQLVPTEDSEITADFGNTNLRIMIPESDLKEWAEDDDKVSYDKLIDHKDGTTLYVLVEKDFKCLKERGEDESDLFENPNA